VGYVSIGIDGRPSVALKNGRNGPKNRGSSNNTSTSASSPANTRIPGGNNNSNNEPCGPKVRNTMASTLVPEGSKAIVPHPPRPPADPNNQVNRYFRGK